MPGLFVIYWIATAKLSLDCTFETESCLSMPVEAERRSRCRGPAKSGIILSDFFQKATALPHTFP